MRVLLDTHIFIWWNSHPNLLPLHALEICEEPENTLLLSLASLWEMQIKIQLGKLTFQHPLPHIIAVQQEDNDLELLPISIEHIYGLRNLPPHHKDPFDRLIIAQAIGENLPILTVDPVFQQYAVDLMEP